MAKKSPRHPARYERSQPGCMRGLIGMFDFRHGRTDQKLLMDRGRGRRLAVGAGLPKNQLEMLTNQDKEESMAAEAGAVSIKPSVKRLIEEEMSGDQDVKKGTDLVESSDKVDCQRKNGKRTNRRRSKSFDILLEDQDADDFRCERHSLRNSKKRSAKSVDMDAMMEEFYRQVQQQEDEIEVHDLSNQNNPDFEEKLKEAIKHFITQKLVNEHVKEDGDHQPSKELMDALQILNSDGELVLKHLQGPKSILVKFVDSVLNTEVVNERDSKLLTQSNLIEQGVHYKQQKFFRRKDKCLEKNTLRPDLTSEPSSRIVVLKPGFTALQSLAVEGSIESSPRSPLTFRNKGPSERVGSYLFLTKLRRKLKNALGKERKEISARCTSDRPLNDHRVAKDYEKGYKDNVGRKSPSKDHFFMEKIVRPSKAGKNGEKTKQLQECGTCMECEIGQHRKQRLTNLYIEAKKHLSEVLRNEDGDANFPSEQSPKTLKRILSLPESCSSPIGSPGRDYGQFTGKQKLDSFDDSQKEDHVCHVFQPIANDDTQSCSTGDRSNDQNPLPPDANSSDSNELHNNDLENACSGGDEISNSGTEILQATEPLVHGKISTSSVDSGPSSSTILVDDQDGDLPGASNENTYAEIQPLPSPSACPSISPIAKNIEKLEETNYLSERQSPVSVLDPPFIEEDISPASIRSQAAELLVQPVRIQFEDFELSSIERNIPLVPCEKDKESIYEYVEAVLLASGMRWDDFYVRHCSDQLLDQSIFDEVDFFFDELCCDKKLLFDCINEVLMEIYWQYSGCFPGLSIMKPAIRPIPDAKTAISEVWEGLQWHLRPLPLPRALDQIVNKDLSKSRMWMDLRSDTETVLVQIGERIFEDLMEETTLVLLNISLETDNAFIAEGLEGSKTM